MTKHTYVGDPKLVVAEPMTYFEFSEDDLNLSLPDVSKNGYKVYPDTGDSYWLSKNEFESKFFKISNSSLLQKAKEFKVKLRTNKSISLKTSNGVERPSLMISNAALTVIADWAKNGLLEEK
tara:strand:- start:191 stop:556 length:366 start_codon:yes stop_codon:yes gene_type:complete